MRLFLISIIFLVIQTEIFCQTSLSSFYNDYLVTKNRNRDYFSRVNGTPFENPDFLPANIYMNDNTTPFRRDLRYNNLFDEMEFLETNKDNVLILENKDRIDSISMDNKTYVFLKYTSKDKTTEGGYFILLVNGSNRLLLRKTKVFVPEKAPTVGYETFQQASVNSRPYEYYFQKGDNFPELIPSNMKAVQKYFLEQGYDLANFIKERKLKNNQESLIEIVNHLNSLN